MIKNILVFSMFGFMLVALFLFMKGVTGSTDPYGLTYIQDFQLKTFLTSATRYYNSWNFKIPDIPSVPSISKPSGDYSDVIGALIWIVNLLVVLVNFLVSFLNFFVMFFNTIIAILQFVLSLVFAMEDWLSTFTAMA